jgi:hypothetical protein
MTPSSDDAHTLHHMLAVANVRDRIVRKRGSGRKLLIKHCRMINDLCKRPFIGLHAHWSVIPMEQQVAARRSGGSAAWSGVIGGRQLERGHPKWRAARPSDFH